MDIQSQRMYATPVTNSTLLPVLLMSLSLQKHAPATTSSLRNEYDYIIVGGGASGSVIASRLSEDPRVSVLLLEAGPVPPLLTEVPALCRYFQGTDVDWKFITVPQKHAALGRKNRQIPWATGKMLGGSASLNGMAYVRGNHKDYDNWESLGAKGWNYRNIYRYFLKLEDNRTPAFLANGYHAIAGPITVERPNYQPELKLAASAAAILMGYQFVDPNGEQQTGFYDLQANIRNNQRCSPVKGYLVPGDGRNNLDISINSYVTKVIFDGRRTTAVKFFDGKFREVKVKREVIITAGTVNTPKILMLSGVGPKGELDKAKIPIIADLQVGRNFHDHAGCDYYFTMDPRFCAINEKLSNPQNINQYIISRTGPLASTDNVLIAFLHGINTTDPFDFPNYEIFLGELDGRYTKKMGLKQEVYKQFFEPYENRPIFRCTAQNLRPRSRGTVTLKSCNPFDPPLIDPNYLEDPRDINDIVEGLKFCKKLLSAGPLLSLGVKPFETLVPGCESLYDEDEYLNCYARTLVKTHYHSVGTAKMGHPLDPTTVTDPQLRVKGVEGLRVADASVMPEVTSGNNHIPVLMIAEKASDMIKNSASF